MLDRGYSPPDRPPKGYDDYPTEAEMRRGESLDERLSEEEPDVDPYAEDDEDDIVEAFIEKPAAARASASPASKSFCPSGSWVSIV